MLKLSRSDDSIITGDMKYINYISYKKRYISSDYNKYRSDLHLISKFIQYIPFSSQNFKKSNKISLENLTEFNNRSDGLFYKSKHISNITFDSIRIFRFSNSSKNYVLPCITKSKEWKVYWKK